jgi:hypothetical protein
VLGAIGVNALKSWATRAFPDLWLLILGALFIVVTLFLPKGLAGIPNQLRGLKQRYISKTKPAPADALSSTNHSKRVLESD